MTGLTCRTDFSGERSLCTVECGGSVGCPGNTVCRPVIDYNGEPEGSFCLVPCNTNAECMALGSQCDDRPSAGGEYCF
jgi:hypothetical protein